MDDAGYPGGERERFEQQYLEKLKTAEKAYRAAAEEYKSIRAEFGDMLNHPDGASAVHNAANRECVAMENYSRALKAFMQVIVFGRLPPSHGDPKS